MKNLPESPSLEKIASSQQKESDDDIVGKLNMAGSCGYRETVPKLLDSPALCSA